MDQTESIISETAPYVSYPSAGSDRFALAIELFPVVMAAALFTFVYLRVS
jgi:hypothetical protein